jgi:hypothetical protein
MKQLNGGSKESVFSFQLDGNKHRVNYACWIWHEDRSQLYLQILREILFMNQQF